MSARLLIAAAWLGCAGWAPAQTVLLEEDFNGGSFPPAGWSELNNGVSLGWEGEIDRAISVRTWTHWIDRWRRRTPNEPDL